MYLNKLLIISNCIIFIFFSSFSFSADDISTPSKYQVTMSKLELCTSSDCSDATVLTNTSASFNIASASAGADVGSWINSFELEIGKTYTHIRSTINSTFTIAGYTTNSSISSSYCVTESSPNTAASHNTAPIVDGSNSITTEDMSWVIPNEADADNGSFYGDLSSDFSTNSITKTNDSSTFYWVGTLANSYKPNINSAPKITISFDVANQLRSQQAGADTCYMYVLPPTVSVSLTD